MSISIVQLTELNFALLPYTVRVGKIVKAPRHIIVTKNCSN